MSKEESVQLNLCYQEDFHLDLNLDPFFRTCSCSPVRTPGFRDPEHDDVTRRIESDTVSSGRALAPFYLLSYEHALDDGSQDFHLTFRCQSISVSEAVIIKTA